MSLCFLGAKLPHTELPAISPSQVNVTSTSYPNIGGSNKFELIITHGETQIFQYCSIPVYSIKKPHPTPLRMTIGNTGVTQKNNPLLRMAPG